MKDSTALYQEIESLRKKLYGLIEENDHDVNLESIMEASIALDKLILIYQKEMYEKNPEK